MAVEQKSTTTVTDYEAEQVERANATGRTGVVFVHGLWLLASSWDRWAGVFEEAGYTALQPGWPDDPDTYEEAQANPEVFAKKTIGQVADHYEEIIGRLDLKPAVIGHSFGGLLVQILAGRGLSAATVAVDPAPFRGVLPLPFSALKSASGVLRNPANKHRAVPLSYEQFRYGFANAISEEEAKELYEEFSVPGYQQHNPGVTEIVEIPGRGHALTIDSGWREVADICLQFVQRFVSPSPQRG
jgi:non-heme chloroperoxidase